MIMIKDEVEFIDKYRWYTRISGNLWVWKAMIWRYENNER